MIRIKEALPMDYFIIANLFEELIREIEDRTHLGPNLFHTTNTGEKCRQFIEADIYKVFMAFDEENKKNIGFLSLCESHSLYADGSYAIIQEFFVQPAYRSKGVGAKLLKAAKRYGEQKGWNRFEVTTPPLPAFDRTLCFYEQNGFQITGGRKLKKEIVKSTT
jgi:GNAT superfamily N-acetyltransferase